MGRGPIAQASVEIIRLIGKAIVGGGDSRTTSKLSRAERKTQGATESARADRELFAGMGVVGGICLLIVCLFSFQASGGGKPSQPIEALQLSDAAAVRAALFGATPVLIECTTPRMSGRNLMREAAAEQLLPDSVRLISLDCAPRLLEHFNLPAPQRAPLLLQAGHGMSAPQVVARHTTTQSLVRHLSRWASPAVPILNSTLDLRRHCLSRTACLVLLTSGVASTSAKKAVLAAVGKSHRELGVATLNRKTHTASFTAQLPETSRPVLLALRSTDDANGLGGEARAFKGVISGTDSDTQLELDAFVSTCAKGAGEFMRLDALPKIVPAGERSGANAGEQMQSEELYDPLLSLKRYQQETRLWYQ